MKYFIGFVCGILFCIFTISIDEWNLYQISELNEKNQDLIDKNNCLISIIKEYDKLIPECLKCVYMFEIYDIEWYKNKMENENNN